MNLYVNLRSIKLVSNSDNFSLNPMMLSAQKIIKMMGNKARATLLDRYLFSFIVPYYTVNQSERSKVALESSVSKVNKLQIKDKKNYYQK